MSCLQLIGQLYSAAHQHCPSLGRAHDRHHVVLRVSSTLSVIKAVIAASVALVAALGGYCVAIRWNFARALGSQLHACGPVNLHYLAYAQAFGTPQ
jgi:hypothetical protein